MSAGQIGCVESDIAISDEDFSLGASETWVATCNGDRFICSRVLTGASGNATMSQVNCAPEHAQNGGHPRAAEAAGEPAEPAAPHTSTAEPPTGAGGFKFGQTRAEAAQTCADGNFEFKTSGHDAVHCGGLPTYLGFKATAELTLCGDAVCVIALVADPTLSGLVQYKSFVSVSDALTKKYGPPFERTGSLPAECRGSGIQDCFEHGLVDLQHTWRWPNVSIGLTLNTPGNGDRARLAVEYRRTGGAELQPNAL